MPDCCKKSPKSDPPACCMQKNYNESEDSWRPNAESSLIENEEFPEMSLLDNTFRSTDGYTNISPIASEKSIERLKAVGNRTVTLPKVQRKVDDVSVIYSPLPPPRGTYSQSKSFAQSSPTWTSSMEGYDSEAYNESRDYTDLGPWKNFQLPANIDRMNKPAGTSKSFPRTKVPRPSRNYSTYEDPQPIMDVREIADYWRKLPRHISTPKSPGSFPWTGEDESSVWGQDLSSFDPSNDSPWSKGVRMDSFNVIKYMTPSPKNVQVAPRLNQSYSTPADYRRISPFPAKAYHSQPRPTGPDYSSFKRRFGAQSPQMYGTFTQSPHPKPNLTRTHQPYPTQVNSTFARYPVSPKFQSTFVQRPQTSQANTTFARPNVTQDIYSTPMNATMEGRPQTAQIYQHSYLPQEMTESPAYQRPKTAGPIQSTRIDSLCRTFDLPTTSNISNELNKSPSTLPTGQELAPWSQLQNIENNYQTLLEIRTPRMPGGDHSNSPLQLSINVTCTEKSLLVTPEQRYSILETSSRSPDNDGAGGGYNNNLNVRYCQCP